MMRLAAALLVVAAWLVLEDYDGIFHDATLYAFQAFARLHPDSLAHDVVLRFGSQDDYTIFSALYAPLISAIGLEDAALWVSVVSLALLTGAATLLARRMAGASYALASIALLIAVPSPYGAERVFRALEMFATPRPAAEACVLLGLAACLAPASRARTLVMAAAFALGVALHPLIALPGIAVAAAYLALARWPALDGRRGLALAAITLVVLIGAGALLLPRMDADWLLRVRDRVPYIFVTAWTLDDWAVLAPRAAVLVVAARAIVASDVRRLLRVMLVVLAGALLASWLLADGLLRALAIQAQFWRAAWLAGVLAVLAVPWLVARRDPRTRLALPLLACAWFADSTTLILTFSALAATSAFLPWRAAADAPRGALALWPPRAAWAAAAMLGVFSIFNVLALPRPMFAEPGVPALVNELRVLVLAPVVGVAFALAVHWLGTRTWKWSLRLKTNTPRPVDLNFASVLLAAMLVVLALRPVWQDWQSARMPAGVHERFAAWRALIPPGAEVLCVDDARTCWFVLERASYVSGTQSVQGLFSRDLALEMGRRADELGALADPSLFTSWEVRGGNEPRAGVIAACRASRVDFIVVQRVDTSGEDAALALASTDPLLLFRCADFSARGAARSPSDPRTGPPRPARNAGAAAAARA